MCNFMTVFFYNHILLYSIVHLNYLLFEKNFQYFCSRKSNVRILLCHYCNNVYIKHSVTFVSSFLQ